MSLLASMRASPAKEESNLRGQSRSNMDTYQTEPENALA